MLATPVTLGLMALLALPMAALATTTAAIAQTGGMTVVLPGLGTPLTVDVQLDASGNISQVNVDPVGTYSASQVSGHAVTFDNADGTTQVKIKAGGSRMSVKAAAGTLDALVGSGSWSADVFGTGTKTMVDYTVGKATDGSPTVAIDSVNAPAGIAVVQGTPKTGSEDHESRASVQVAFSLDGFTKRLSISVTVDTEDTHQAALKVTLSGKDRQKLTGPLETLVGGRTWSGTLCDGTAVSFSYTVNPDGTVSYGSATGATATARSGKHGFSVRFADTKARVTVSLGQVKGSTDYALRVSAKLGHCAHSPAPVPTVNTPIQPGADQPTDHHGDGSSGSGDWSGSHDGSHDGGGSRDGEGH
jgi:hypothetical protein